MVNVHKKIKNDKEILCKNLVKLGKKTKMYKLHKNERHICFFFADCTKTQVYI